jgi:hypothetical protein
MWGTSAKKGAKIKMWEWGREVGVYILYTTTTTTPGVESESVSPFRFPPEGPPGPVGRAQPPASGMGTPLGVSAPGAPPQRPRVGHGREHRAGQPPGTLRGCR